MAIRTLLCPAYPAAHRIAVRPVKDARRTRPAKVTRSLEAGTRSFGGKRVIRDQAFDRRGKSVYVRRVDKGASAADDLRQRPAIGCDDRDARGHSLESGEAEPFVE